MAYCVVLIILLFLGILEYIFIAVHILTLSNGDNKFPLYVKTTLFNFVTLALLLLYFFTGFVNYILLIIYTVFLLFSFLKYVFQAGSEMA